MIELKDLTPRRLQIVIIALPMLLATLYFTVFAANRYVSESTVALQQAGNDMSSLPGAALMLAGLSSPSRGETLYLLQYVQSLALLKELDAKLNLRKHFEAERLDVFARLWGGASQEQFLDYYRSRVEVVLDDASSTLTVRVQGFDPAFAQQLNKAILEASERFVNEMSHSLAREKLNFAEQELERSAQRLQDRANRCPRLPDQERLARPLHSGRGERRAQCADAGLDLQIGGRVARLALVHDGRRPPSEGPARTDQRDAGATRSRTRTSHGHRRAERAAWRLDARLSRACG